MNTISLLVRVQDHKQKLLDQMIQSLISQTYQDWTLLLVADSDTVVGFTYDYRIDVITAPKDYLLPWVVNDYLQVMGDRIGYMDQHSLLLPNTLELISRVDSPICYTNDTDRVWIADRPYVKGAFDPVRIKSHDMLGDFTVTKKDHIIKLGGYSREAGDNPQHELYLRSEPADFHYIPGNQYIRIKNPLEKVTRPEDRTYAANYDLESLKRATPESRVEELNGVVHTRHSLDKVPTITALVLYDPSINQIPQFLTPDPQPVRTKVLTWGKVSENLRIKATTYGYGLETVYGSIPEVLNQELEKVDTELVLVTTGRGVSSLWLTRLVEALMHFKTKAISPRIIMGSTYIQPGIPNHIHQNAYWNIRGDHDRMIVPHQVSILTSACFLTYSDIRFDTDFPTLYMADWCIKNQGPFLELPESTVEIHKYQVTEADELSLFRNTYPDFHDPFELMSNQ